MNITQLVNLTRKFSLSNYSLYKEKAVRNLTKGIKPLIFKLRNKKFSPEEAFIVFSEARGGSTWVMETLQKNLNAVTIFEPIWGREGPFSKVVKHTKFASPFYISTNESEYVLKNFLNDTMKGKLVGTRALQFNSFQELMNNEKLLLKLVNVNLIAPWFAENFKLKYKPIYVVRHPLAILASRERYIGNYREDANTMLGKFDRKRLRNKKHPYYNYIEELDKADTKYKRYVTEWCIRNHKFLEGSNNEQFIVVYYEDMVLNPLKILKRIERDWQINTSFGNHTTESGTTAIGEKVYTGRKQLNKWVSFFTDTEKKEFQKILDKFGINTYTAYKGDRIRGM